MIIALLLTGQLGIAAARLRAIEFFGSSDISPRGKPARAAASMTPICLPQPYRGASRRGLN